jgi:hypothetical protein
MDAIFEIHKLSKEDKLRVMEAIWEDLSKEERQLDSPDWHREVLKATEDRFLFGKELTHDWLDAKKKLRKSSE